VATICLSPGAMARHLQDALFDVVVVDEAAQVIDQTGSSELHVLHPLHKDT
jgi:hypothetical protein